MSGCRLKYYKARNKIHVVYAGTRANMFSLKKDGKNTEINLFSIFKTNFCKLPDVKNLNRFSRRIKKNK